MCRKAKQIPFQLLEKLTNTVMEEISMFIGKVNENCHRFILNLQTGKSFCSNVCCINRSLGDFIASHSSVTEFWPAVQ